MGVDGVGGMIQDKNPLARSVIRAEITRLDTEIYNINQRTQKLQAEINFNNVKVKQLKILVCTLTKSLSDLP